MKSISILVILLMLVVSNAIAFETNIPVGFGLSVNVQVAEGPMLVGAGLENTGDSNSEFCKGFRKVSEPLLPGPYFNWLPNPLYLSRAVIRCGSESAIEDQK